MIKRLSWLTILLLTGCVTHQVSQHKVAVPTKLSFANQEYQLSKTDDLGSVVKYTYQLIDTNSNKHSHLEIFQDLQQDFAKTDANYQQRIALREKMFARSDIKVFSNQTKDGNLYSYVVYPPAEQFTDYQVDVAKGENLASCGFVQLQYSEQFAPVKSSTMAVLKKLEQQQALPLVKTMTQYSLPWSCNEK
ncbi:hypothetical protein QV08_08430 [Gallibacterium salpingitidis]|uniref:hypothetical protein n=1 Tax=Gallibacterium salpingitidis TaxID=505341 RepID=UPI000805E93D|nr:hypothetical protein [Gallibacterium salpingitidis]OBX07008.1 hypothetical protein QV08_08430 [Gallibacterium salpingitidis]